MSDYLKPPVRTPFIDRMRNRAKLALVAFALIGTAALAQGCVFGDVVINEAPPCGGCATTPIAPPSEPTKRPNEYYIPPAATATPLPTPTRPAEVRQPPQKVTTVPPKNNEIPVYPDCPLPKNWPQNAVEASNRIGGGFADWQTVRHMENGKWNGGYDFEGAKKLNNGITYDSKLGIHRKADGSITYNHNEIFDWKAGVAHIDVTLADQNGWMFARRGGDGGGLEPNVSYNVGTVGVTVRGVEQAAFSPVCEECIPGTNVSKSAAEAWHNAVREFTWNGDAQNNNVKIIFYNPDSGQMEQLNGNMITALARAGIKVNTEKIPVGYPLFPGEVVKLTGGTTKAEWWTPVIENGLWSGQWVMEAFPHKPEVYYDLNNGVYRKRGSNAIVTDINAIFDFSKWPETQGQWPIQFDFIIPNQARGFARAANPNSAAYLSTSGPVDFSKTNKTGTEQGALIAECLISPEQATTQDAQQNGINNGDIQNVFVNGQKRK